MYTNCFFGVGRGFVPEGMRFSRFICVINGSYIDESILLILAFNKLLILLSVKWWCSNALQADFLCLQNVKL